jgi:lipoprotein signal peptidase
MDFLRSMPAIISLGLILGGTVGNLIDRLSYGYVIDFIDFSFFATSQCRRFGYFCRRRSSGLLIYMVI